VAKFTPAQQKAIDCNDYNILVSAAAGSGKTAVLTERIVRHVSGNNRNLDDLLIVTFTEAASAEMRTRIGKRLQELDNLTQVARLPIANISTIHAFCSKLVRENFQAVDIDPAFRIGDDAELSIIRRQVMDELFEEEYLAENAAFLDLVDVYGGKTMDGRLDVLVRKIHQFMESDPFPEVAAARYAGYFDGNATDLGKTEWAKIVREELELGLEGAIEGTAQAIAICSQPGGADKYLDKLNDEKDMLEDLKALVYDSSFEEMYQAFTCIDWGRLPTVSKKDEVDPHLQKQAQEIRNNAVKKRVSTLVKGVFFAPPDKMQSDLNALAPRVFALMQLATKFAAAFAEEKRARNILDFSDLEHFAVRILYPNGPTDLTPSAAYKFYEVLIDEYQDSNEVQDLILTAVADRRFMVGDVKQSVYRFRRANPKLFLQKYENYQNPENGTRIDLSFNFRSRPEVLDAVNFFFSQLMCKMVGDVEYDNNAALHPGREEYPQLPNPPHMYVELLDQKEDDVLLGESDDEDEETPDNIAAEARVIAKNIRELLDEPRMVWDKTLEQPRPCKPSDIVVLTRSLASIAAVLIEELKNHGIDAVADLNTGFLDQLEVKTALAFLRVIDNPRQDIDLITVLHSPVYGMTEDELVEIKLAHAEGQLFYDNLLVSGNPKVQKFFADLKKWRNAAVYTPVSRLIGMIYDDTAYPAHVLHLPGDQIRQANLRLLLERAMEFEKTSFKGLFHFVNYIERLYDSGVSQTGAIAEPGPGAEGQVRLMTIHKSKGLEFPVVICSFLGKQFNTEDTKQPVILHSEFGVGPYYVDTKRRTRSNTLARFGLSRLLARESLSEELRCLYVAFTRAEELLILTARSKNFEKAVEKWANYIGGNDITLPAYYRSGVKSYLDWVMPCVLRQPDKFRMRTHRPLQAGDKTLEVQAGKAYVTLKPHEAEISALPSKLSISEIRRLYDITPDSTFLDDPAPTFELPEFLKKKTAPTPAEIGTALHTVAEHLDYNRHKTLKDIEVLIIELAEKNFLTPEEIAFVDRSKIETLVNSPLAERIRQASSVQKETPFVLALPATELYPNTTENETILVHGIIDCYFVENDEIVIVDYKSDSTPEKHLTQMEIYKKAIAAATAKNVKEVLIYSFALGKAVALTASSN